MPREAAGVWVGAMKVLTAFEGQTRTSSQSMCPRCRQPATKTAARRGHCTACGASLGPVGGADETLVRNYLHSRANLRGSSLPGS